MAIPKGGYQAGTVYALVSVALLAVQEPFSALAAKRLSSASYLGLTQFAVLIAVPLLALRARDRRDLFVVLCDWKSLGKLGILFAIGLCGLLLFKFGLSGANPIIVAAILNLSPFWAVVVARTISGKAVPVSPVVFWGCFLVAFAGAMAVALSQSDGSTLKIAGIAHATWLFAIPVPLFYALSGTLVGKWFSDVTESAALAANFLVSAIILIPAALIVAYASRDPSVFEVNKIAVLLLVIGTFAAAAIGRLFYQRALTMTRNDNGFVTMFFLLIPAMSALISLPLSWGIEELRFAANPMFYGGLGLIMASLAAFSIKSWRSANPEPSEPGIAVIRNEPNLRPAATQSIVPATADGS